MPALRTSVVFVAAVVAAVLFAGCSARKAPAVLPPVSAPAVAVVRTATSLVGAPYRDGGEDPSGFDCSGFVRYVFAQHGIAAPRDVRRQWLWGAAVAREDVRAGDLLFFSTKGSGPTHVTLAIDDGRFVHAPSARGVVRIESLASSYWARRFVGARRPAGSAR